MRRVSAIDGEKIGGNGGDVVSMPNDPLFSAVFCYLDCSIVSLEEIIAVKRGSGLCPCMDRGLKMKRGAAVAAQNVQIFYFLPTRHFYMY